VFSDQLHTRWTNEGESTRQLVSIGSMLSKVLPIILSAAFAAAAGGSLMAQTAKSGSTQARAEKFELKPSDAPIGGALFITAKRLCIGKVLTSAQPDKLRFAGPDDFRSGD